MKRNLTIGVASILLATGVLLYAVAPVAAAFCAGYTVTLDDGSGHEITNTATSGSGTCASSAVSFHSNLAQLPGTCVGSFGIAHSNWNDCVNWVRFDGPWRAGTFLCIYRDAYMTGTSQKITTKGVWVAANSNEADQVSSFTTQPSGGC